MTSWIRRNIANIRPPLVLRFLLTCFLLRGLMYISGWECINVKVIISRKDCETHQECVKRLFPSGLRTAGCRAQANHQSGNILEKLLRRRDVTDTLGRFSYPLISGVKIHFEKRRYGNLLEWNNGFNVCESIINTSVTNQTVHVTLMNWLWTFFDVHVRIFLREKKERRGIVCYWWFMWDGLDAVFTNICSKHFLSSISSTSSPFWFVCSIYINPYIIILVRGGVVQRWKWKERR